MSASQAVLLGGVFNTALFVFHVFFWRLFNWPEGLASVSFINRAVMQILNVCLMFVFGIFAYISFFHADEMLGTTLGRVLLVLIAAFWFLRALLQIVFFGLKRPVSIAFFMVFMTGAVLYAWPAYHASGLT